MVCFHFFSQNGQNLDFCAKIQIFDTFYHLNKSVVFSAKIQISNLASFYQIRISGQILDFCPSVAFLGWIFYLYIYLVPIFSLVETPWRIRMIWTTKPIQSTFWLINLHYVYSSFPVVGECLFRSTDGRSLSKAIQGHL